MKNVNLQRSIDRLKSDFDSVIDELVAEIETLEDENCELNEKISELSELLNDK